MYRYHRLHIPVSHVRVETATYERVHGTQPGGIALWHFQVGAEVCAWFGVYAEAEAQAVARAARCGIDVVAVCA